MDHAADWSALASTSLVGEQAAAMPPDMVHGGVDTVRVEVTDGVLDQVNMVVAQDRASSSCPIAREQLTIKQVPIEETP